MAGMEITVGVYDAKARLSELIKLAQAGNDVIIVDVRAGGIPLARLVPYQEESENE